MNQYKQYLYYQVQAPNKNESLSLIFVFPIMVHWSIGNYW